MMVLRVKLFILVLIMIGFVGLYITNIDPLKKIYYSFLKALFIKSIYSNIISFL